MTNNEMTIKEIHDNLNLMGFEVSLENLAKMKPTELKKFHKKARKAFESFYSVQRVVSRLSADGPFSDECGEVVNESV